MNDILKVSRRYAVSIPPKLILLNKNLDELKKYENILGGIYSITPIGISSVFSKDYISATNIEISGIFPDLKVKIEYLNCIDFEKCTYCGKCYKVCPENCITHNLDIDMSKCTFCNKCSDVCDENAINVSSIKEEIFNVPFILTDSEEILENYKDKTGIYDSSQTDKILSLTGEFIVEESISHNENICQYSGKLGYGCKRCLEACEHDALYIENEQINVNHVLCVSCGKCVSVCPTGAMQVADFNDYDFMNYIKKSNFKPNDIFVFGSSEEIRKLKWESENFSDEFIFFESESKFLNLMHYLFLFSVGFSKVIILNEKLKDNNQVKFTNKLIEFMFSYKNFITDNYEDLPKQNNITNPLKIFYSNYSFQSRRTKISSILKFLYENTEIGDVQINEDYLNIFGEVTVDGSKCSLCLACVSHCKIGALTSKQENYSLNHTPSICIQCKICENLCPEDAIKVVPGLKLTDNYFTDKELCSDEPIVCPGCNKVFGSMKTFERVKEKLIDTGLFETKGKYIHYCEECRVKRIFEDK